LLKELQLEIELAPPGSDETAQRQGFTQPKAIHHNPFQLHYAAKNGDIKEIKHLVESGWNVNQEDAYSSRPLYVASKYGHLEAVKYFIAKGADIHDDGYTGETALHEAIYKKHYDVARVLVEMGHAIVTMPNMKDISPLNMVLNTCFNIIKEPIDKIGTPESIKEIHELIETISVFSKHCGSHCLDTLPRSDFATDRKSVV
jgi:ankyrin repeat protein